MTMFIFIFHCIYFSSEVLLVSNSLKFTFSECILYYWNVSSFLKNFRLRYLYQIRSVAQSCLTLCDPMNRSTQHSLSITNSRSSLRLMSTESVMPSSHLILCRPLLLLPPIPPSIGVFSNESTLLMRWPKYWSFSFSIISFQGSVGSGITYYIYLLWL